MRFLFSMLLGAVLGGAAAGAILYFNPLTNGHEQALGGFERVLRYELPQDALAFARGERTRLPGEADRSEPLWEDAIARTASLAVVLRDADGVPAAIASRLLAASADTDLIMRGLLVADHWLVTIPDQGSLFVQTESNVWPLLKDGVIPVRYLGRPWDGLLELTPTAGPGPEHTALAIGATGRFAGQRGAAAEHYRVTAIEPLAAAAQLALDLPDASATPQAPAAEQR